MSRISGINIKRLKLTTIVLLSPLIFFAQTLTGLWSGVMSNDSTTVRKDQSFEIALTEYKGKVYGYSCSEFIVNDTLFYIVKRVEGTIVGDVCEVTDDKIIAYNFRGKLDKGIKVTSTFRRNNSDSTWYLEGTWKTSATKKYYSVTGKVGLKEEKDMAMSKLFPHLEELNLANDVAFYKEKKETPMLVRIAKPEKVNPEYTEKTAIGNTAIAIVPGRPDLKKAETDALPSINRQDDIDVAKTDIKTIPSSSVDISPSAVNKTISEQQDGLPSVNKQNNPELAKTDTKNVGPSSVDLAPASVNKTIAETKKPAVNSAASSTNTVALNKPVTTKTEEKPAAVLNKPAVRQEQPVVKTQTTAAKQPDAIVSKPETKPVAASVSATTTSSEPVAVAEKPVIRKTDAEITQGAAVIDGRKSEFSQLVNFKSDSLVLALYDNGEIDGDTVSVFMNGEVLMAKQGLKSKAIKKTIYITAGNEDFSLVLFADNLGKYPPNTGLLVVHDGDDVYNLRFSSDLQKSAGIVFRRKK